VIHLQSFTLIIGTEFAQLSLPVLTLVDGARTFSPLQSTPAHHVNNVFNGARDLSLLISVLDTEQEVTTVHLGEQIVVEGGSEATDVHHAGWRWRVPRPNPPLHLISSILVVKHLS